MNPSNQQLGAVIRSLPSDFRAWLKGTMVGFDTGEFVNKRRQVLAEAFARKPWALAARVFILWPIGFLIVAVTLMGGAMFTKEYTVVWESLTLPIYYLIVMCVPVLLAEVSGHMMRRRWGNAPPQREMLLWGAAVFPMVAVASYLGLLTIPLYVFDVVPDVFDPSPALTIVALLPAGAITSRVVWRQWIVKGIQAQLDAAEGKRVAAEQQRLLAEASLAVMQAQIEPHFLFNTLANIQHLVRKEPQAGDFMLSQFIRYLRAAMPSMRTNLSTVGREMDLVDSYLKMATVRMGGRLTVKVECAPELNDIELPPVVIQTLVENALIHGIEPKVGPVSIEVAAAKVDGRLEITVTDDGVGIGGAQTSGTGTGLRNIRERLAFIFADRARLIVESREPSGVVSRVSIDLKSDAGAH